MSENRIKFLNNKNLSYKQQSDYTNNKLNQTKLIKHKMNQQQRQEFYPTISYNNRFRCESRWENDANVYGDISNDWQISLGNGKRLNRKWRKCDGLTYVCDNYGRERAIYNENYDSEWQKALPNMRGSYYNYDRSMQPDGEPGFYSNQM